MYYLFPVNMTVIPAKKGFIVVHQELRNNLTRKTQRIVKFYDSAIEACYVWNSQLAYNILPSVEWLVNRP